MSVGRPGRSFALAIHRRRTAPSPTSPWHRRHVLTSPLGSNSGEVLDARCPAGTSWRRGCENRPQRGCVVGSWFFRVR